ncbi:MAG: alanine racemase [Bacteroidales bacterium]|nr:alanine racemase [Bacteroidales bacterium]
MPLMPSTSIIEIDRYAIENNVSFIKSLCTGNTRISAVVKGNAYGHGSREIIRIVEDLGIRHFAVYSSAEAREALPHCSPESNLMIMGFIALEDLDWILLNGIEFFISDPEWLDQVIYRSKSLNTSAKVHLEVETGMNRTGMSLAQLRMAVKIIQQNERYIKVIGVASHFAGAESIANHKRIKKQLSVFSRRISFLNESGIRGLTRHIASSAALINYPESRFDMVRTGILIYGYWPTRETQISYVQRKKDRIEPLKRAINWYSRVMQLKHVPEGEFIGYGLFYQADRKMKTMIVPVGYCNGYSRSLSNNGHVIVNGQRSPVIGIVNMNMIICDISEISGVKNGDRVTLIGKQNEVEISFSSFAEMNNSLNYEILARLPENIERIVIQ